MSESKTTAAGETSPVAGIYKGRPIPEWIDAPERGGRHTFNRVAYEDPDGSVPLSQLRLDEFVTHPGLIYRRVGGQMDAEETTIPEYNHAIQTEIIATAWETYSHGLGNKTSQEETWIKAAFFAGWRAAEGQTDAK